MTFVTFLVSKVDIEICNYFLFPPLRLFSLQLVRGGHRDGFDV